MIIASALISPVVIVIAVAAFLLVVALLAAAMVVSYRLRMAAPAQAPRADRGVPDPRRLPRRVPHPRSRGACARARGRSMTERARRSGPR